MDKAKFCQARLLERVDFTDDLALFRFQTDRPLAFKPGQYATLAAEADGALVQRAYSIASSPYEPTLEFFIERVPQGALTPRLWDMRPDDSLLVRQKVVGRFVEDDSGAFTRHLMLATVTGIAPYLSMARTHRLDAARGTARPGHLGVLHGASHARELGSYRDELETLARDGWLTYVPTVSRPWEEAGWQGETGRVEDLIRKYADAWGFNCINSVAYACGHPQMIANAHGVLTRACFPKAQIREELYFTA